MSRIIPFQSFHSRAAVCAVAVLIVSACQNVPKYKKGSRGKFDEWGSYEGKHFGPLAGTVAAIDLSSNSVTINQGKDKVVFTVTPATRIMHERTDITLAQLPLKQDIKYTVSEDGKQLLTIWYGTNAVVIQRHTPAKQKNTFY